MQREISFEWSHELVRYATLRFISRYAGGSLIAAAILMIVSIVALVVGRAEGFWWVGIFLPVIYFLIWLGYYMRSVRICDEMPDRKVTVRLDPESITFETSEHSTMMKWSGIRKLWRYSKVLLLFTYDQQTYSMLPVAPLGEDGRRFIEEKVREHGGQVM
jgi:hypothetical protein